jgi:hypothetical protein
MLDIEEKVAIVSARLLTLSYQQVQQNFERNFRKSAPSRDNMRLVVNKFKRTGSVLDEKRSGRLQTSEDNVGRIQQALNSMIMDFLCRPVSFEITKITAYCGPN